jgi:hypothetical protein
MQQGMERNARNNRLWRPAESRDEASRRASGRERYNARRQFRAAHRRSQIVEMWADLGKDGWSPFNRGSQTYLAEFFKVHRSTICRDMVIIKRMWRAAECPTCETVLDMQRIDDLEGRGKIRVTEGQSHR